MSGMRSGFKGVHLYDEKIAKQIVGLGVIKTWKRNKQLPELTVKEGKIYFRSKTEANWARWLDFQLHSGELANWLYEPVQFRFGVFRRNNFYKPDFLLINKDGTYIFHEVKGWMDNDSKVRMNRMKRFYPEINVELVMATRVKAVGKKMSGIIDGWE